MNAKQLTSRIESTITRLKDNRKTALKYIEQGKRYDLLAKNRGKAEALTSAINMLERIVELQEVST